MLAANSSSNKNTGNGCARSTSSSNRRRGAFIVFEGVDRCGKTTQSALLLKRLNERSGNKNHHPVGEDAGAIAMRFPNRETCTGQLINQYLQTQSGGLNDHTIHLLFSANRWEAIDTICQSLQEGKTIVCDRYAYSGVAFSSAKVHTNEENQAKQEPVLSLDWCQAPDKGLPAPDCVIFLDLSQEEAEKRGGYGGERYEKRDMQIRVRQQFDKLRHLDDEKAKSLSSCSSKTKQSGVPVWKIVNAAQSVEQVHADIWSIVEETLQNIEQYDEESLTPEGSDDATILGGKPVYKLWEDGCVDLAQYSTTTSIASKEN